MEFVKQAGRSFYSDLNLAEISGSLGDLGTFLPLLVRPHTACIYTDSSCIMFLEALYSGGDAVPKGLPALHRIAPKQAA